MSFDDSHHLDLFSQIARRVTPLTYTVLTEWGVGSCEDIGEMMFNLTEGHRVRKDEDDTPESFLGGYDFKETFLGPYAV